MEKDHKILCTHIMKSHPQIFTNRNENITIVLRYAIANDNWRMLPADMTWSIEGKFLGSFIEGYSLGEDLGIPDSKTLAPFLRCREVARLKGVWPGRAAELWTLLFLSVRAASWGEIADADVPLLDKLCRQLCNQLITEDFSLHRPSRAPAKRGLKPAPTPRWVDDVQEALQQLGGDSSLTSLYRQVREIRKRSGRSTPQSLEAIVRRTLEDHSSDSQNYRGGADLFRLADLKGNGQWRLR